MESLFGIIVEAWNPWSNTKALWPSTKVRSHRLLILDGLRMVAIVWHVSGEAWTSTFWPRQADRVEFLGTAQYVLNADLSYDILLLVSGVAITSSVLAEIEPTGVFDFKRFIFRRWCGIWPALAAGLLVTVLLDKNSSNHCRCSATSLHLSPIPEHSQLCPVLGCCGLRAAMGLFACVSCLTVAMWLRRDEWPFVLLLANNYFGDLQCMPQTWLIAVLFQLYVLTPVLMFACVNYEVRQT